MFRLNEDQSWKKNWFFLDWSYRRRSQINNLRRDKEAISPRRAKGKETTYHFLLITDRLWRNKPTSDLNSPQTHNSRERKFKINFHPDSKRTVSSQLGRIRIEAPCYTTDPTGWSNFLISNSSSPLDFSRKRCRTSSRLRPNGIPRDE